MALGAATGSLLLFGAGGLSGCYNGPAEKTDGDATTAGSSDENYYSLVEEGKLTIASPFNCLPYAGKSVDVMNGFAYELLGDVAEKLGLEASWVAVETDADALMRATAEGQRVVGGEYKHADVALVIAGEVPDSLENTMAYVESPIVMVSKKANDIPSVDDLVADERVGVIAGSDVEAWLRQKNDGKALDIHTYAASGELFSDLQARNVDAVFCDQAMAFYELRVAYGDCEVKQTFDDKVQYYFYVNSENANLINGINDALEQLDDDGTYNTLAESWISEVDNSRGKVETRLPPQGAETHYKGTN